MAKKMSSYLPVLGITDHTTPKILAWLQSLTGQLNEHLAIPLISWCTPFLGRFFTRCTLFAHVWRDPGSRQYIEDNPDLLRWMHAVQDGPSLTGSFSEDDHVAETLLPILRHQREVQFPVLRETFRRVHAKVTASDFDGKLPRSLGTAEISIGGATAHRRVLVMNQWKAQRIFDTLASFTPTDRDKALEWAETSLGYSNELKDPPTTRVEYQGYRLGVEPIES